MICHYENGATIIECGKAFGIGHEQAYQLLKKHAPEVIRKPGPNPNKGVT